MLHGLGEGCSGNSEVQSQDPCGGSGERSHLQNLPHGRPTPRAQAYWQAMQAGQAPYPFYGSPAAAPGMTPYASEMTPEQELDYLKNQADMIKGQLERVEARLRDLGVKRK